MPLSNAERQRRWRKRHPEKAAERLATFKAKKEATSCTHSRRGIAVPAWYCGDCGHVMYREKDINEARKKLRGQED